MGSTGRLQSLRDFLWKRKRGNQLPNPSPAKVIEVMQKISELRPPYAFWFSIGANGFGGTRASINPDGRPRSNGDAFKQFIQSNFR